MREQVDFDQNATTPLDARVGQGMVDVITGSATGNPSSVHGLGRRARALVETARRRVAQAVESDPLEVTFTSGGTESDALAILGVCRGRQSVGAPCGLMTSGMEHPAVLGSAERLRAEGVPIVYVAPSKAGVVEPASVAECLLAHPEIGLLSFAAANHELGTQLDVAELVRVARAIRPDILVHTDAVQAFGKVPVSFSQWDVDLLSVSSHKINGPAGVGALIHRREVKLLPLVFGGHQERGIRPGTEPLVLLHGFGLAAELATVELEQRQQVVRRCRDRFLAGLAGLDIDCSVVGATNNVGNTVYLRFPGCTGELLTINLDLSGFAVSTGSACTAGRVEPSSVLQAIGYDANEASSGIRVSFGTTSTVEQVDAFLDCLPSTVQQVRNCNQELERL